MLQSKGKLSQRSRSLAAFAGTVIERIMNGDKAAYLEPVQLVDVLFEERLRRQFGVAEGAQLLARARIEITTVAGRLRTRPADPVDWIWSRVAILHEEQIRRNASDRDRAVQSQQPFLHETSFKSTGVDVACDLRPFDALSGDFVYHTMRGEEVLVVLGDVMGKRSDMHLSE